MNIKKTCIDWFAMTAFLVLALIMAVPLILEHLIARATHRASMLDTISCKDEFEAGCYYD